MTWLNQGSAAARPGGVGPARMHRVERDLVRGMRLAHSRINATCARFAWA